MALALMLTEWPAGVKEGFIKKIYAALAFLVRSLLGRSDSLLSQTNRKCRFNTVLPLAHRIAQIEEIESKAGRQWTILSGKTTHREKLYM